MEAKLTRSKAEQASNSCTITLKGMTQGEAIALLNALSQRTRVSSVCADIYTATLLAAAGAWPEMVAHAARPEDWEG